MARQRSDYTFDSDLELKDAGAVAASAAAQVGGADRVLDVGPGRIDGVVILDITAADVAAGDEATIFIQGSPDGPGTAAFEAAAYVALGAVIIGDVTLNGSKVDSGIGRRELHFTNEVNGVIYRYLRLYTLIAASGAATYTAFLAKAK